MSDTDSPTPTTITQENIDDFVKHLSSYEMPSRESGIISVDSLVWFEDLLDTVER